MDFNFGLYTIRAVGAGDWHSMRDQLKKLNQAYLVIEDAEGDSREGVLYRVQSSIDNRVHYCCVFYESEFSRPQIIVRSMDACDCWILFDRTLAIVSFEPPQCFKQVKLPCFYWTAFRIRDRLVVIHELGATCFDFDGNVVWDVSGDDKMNDYRVEDNVLTCIFDSGQRKSQSLLI